MGERKGKESNATKRLSKWRESEVNRLSKMNENKYKIQIFYEKTLPSDIDLSNVSLVERKYTTNPKLGNVYEIRQETVPRPKPNRVKSPTSMQENNIWLWKNEDQLVHYLRSKGHTTVRHRDGMRLSSLQREQEISTNSLNKLEKSEIRSMPTSENLRQWFPNKAERFRRRSMSVSGIVTGSSNNFDHDDKFRERSQSISSQTVYRRPTMTTSTFNRPASDVNLSLSRDRTNSQSNGNAGQDCVNIKKKYHLSRLIPKIKISHVDDDP